jgi:enolase
MRTITKIAGYEVLDSRGNPTVEAEVELSDGSSGWGIAPSGASTGRREAVELRDGDADRFGGKGVTRAVAAVNTEIAAALNGHDGIDQRGIDATMCKLDGTPNKARLGANALVAVSIACVRAAAASTTLPLYRYLGGADACVLPVPMFNVLNGGAHAQTTVDFQEFMLVPLGMPTFAEALRAGSECFHSLRAVLHDRRLSTGQGDEGGFAPDFENNEAAIIAVVEAIKRAGYRPGDDVAIALDPATSGLFSDGQYHLRGEGRDLTPREMVDLWERWVDTYPIVLLEDGMAEDDWDGWELLTARIGERIQLIGDDIFVTNAEILQRGIDRGIANGVLIKLNQIGTVTETLDTMRLATRNGYATMISHRSGETEDTTIADLAVATNAGEMKSGAPSRSERVAKYNRLLRIERELGGAAQFAGRQAFDVRVHRGGKVPVPIH